MARAVRALLALIVAVVVVGLSATQLGFPVVASGIGVRVGLPGAVFQLLRALLPVVAALFVTGVVLRFGIRVLRSNATPGSDFRAGGRLLVATSWAIVAWVVFELFFRQLWLGWATVFGSVSVSLYWLSAAVVVALCLDRLVPWTRAPRGLGHLGLALLVALSAAAALAAWDHRGVASRTALGSVALVGLVLVASGVRRVENGARLRVFAELGAASMLLAGPLWSLLP
jgi:hypothetical protein